MTLPRLHALVLGGALAISACELTPSGTCDDLQTDCGPATPDLCTEAEACLEPAKAERTMCEEACGDLDACPGELCLVECLGGWLAAKAQCYVDHPCDWSDAAAEEWTCKEPAINDARDCLGMCSDESAAQACADALDEATTACEPSPFD